MRNFKSEGIIIKRRNINEADKLLTVLTRTGGKQQFKAPGVRKISSRRSPHLELLNRVTLTLYTSTKTSIVTEAQMIADYSLIKLDLQKVGYAYHICEIVDGLCAENEENEAVFFLMIQTLDELCMTVTPAQVVQKFEFSLLEHLGFATEKMKNREFFNMDAYIESILEKKLKAKDIFFERLT